MAKTRPNTGTHQPDDTFLADYKFWSKMPHWEVNEAAAVLIGLNPHFARYGISEFGSASPYFARFRSLQELAHRFFESNQIVWPVTPVRWIEWAQGREIPIDAELVSEAASWDAKNSVSSSAEIARIKELEAQLAQTGKELREAKERDAKIEKALGTRERETVLKIIIAMAIKGYSYDPRLQRSDRIKEIENDTEACGVHVTDDTIRRYLREATPLLPPTETP